MTTHRRTSPSAAALLLFALAPALGAPAWAQQADDAPALASFVVAGYGTANYGGTLADDYRHDFSASLSPILLFGLGPDVLFEAEFEFGLEAGETTTALEYAQVDYLGFERLQLSFGKFLLPFGVFSERIHPSWINKLPSMPLLYGHAHGGVAEGALLPILSDLGAMARLNVGLGSMSNLGIAFFVTQGPRPVTTDGSGEVDDDHAHALVPDPPVRRAEDPTHEERGIPEVPSVAFGTNTSDNNQNKMLGARVGLVRAPGVEVYVSGFHAMYDEGDYLDYTGGALTLEWRRGAFDLRAEGVTLRQEFVSDAEYVTLQQDGYYVQASRRFGNLEPVARWSQLLDGEVEGVVARPGREELSVGFNYWVSPSVPLKVAYAWDPDFDDRLYLQWAFGF